MLADRVVSRVYMLVVVMLEQMADGDTDEAVWWWVTSV